MTDYTQNYDYSAKGALSTGDPLKKIKGSEIDEEFANISTAISSKEDSANKGAASGYAGLDSDAEVAWANAKYQEWQYSSLSGDVTLAEGDTGTLYVNSSGSTHAITFDDDSDIPVGATFKFICTGASSEIDFTCGTGVTLRKLNGSSETDYTTAGQPPSPQVARGDVMVAVKLTDTLYIYWQII